MRFCLERMGVLNKEKTAVWDSYASNVEQFVNRIMVLHVEQQNRFFEQFYERYLAAVEAAKRAGAFDFGVEEIRARNLRSVAEPQTLFVDPASGARTTLHEREGEVDVERRTFETVLGIYAGEGFYRNLRSERIYDVGPAAPRSQRNLSRSGVPIVKQRFGIGTLLSGGPTGRNTQPTSASQRSMPRWQHCQEAKARSVDP